MIQNIIFIILCVIILLFIWIKLIDNSNYIKNTSNTSSSSVASCSQTYYGCCPNGVDSKLNILGTNCPPYKVPNGNQPIPSGTTVIVQPVVIPNNSVVTTPLI